MKSIPTFATLALAACAFAAPAAAQTQANCASVPQAMPIAEDSVAPAAELSPIQSGLGRPAGVLTQAYRDAVSADMLLLRLRVETCRRIASTLPAPSPANPNDPAAYKPQTQWDNSPWRFNMDKNMTAAEFEAWMKAKGLRVAKGAPQPVAPATNTQQPVAPQPESGQPQPAPVKP